MGTKHEVIRDALREYLAASKDTKSRILTRLEQTVKMHRKAILRRLRVLSRRVEEVNWHDRRGRPTEYGYTVTEALRYLWGIAHEICAERLHAVRGEYLAPLMRDGMWPFGKEVTEKLRRMSIGTMKSRIASFDRVVSGGGRCLTKPSDLKELIPVRRGPWENPPPGVGEVDTVAHCGNSVSGEFAYTVQYTDICLTWCLLEGQMGKGKRETKESIKRMQRRLPFLLVALDPDSGAEFVNWHLKEWCDEHGIGMTRIRPGMKNDHGRIEQKNDKNVRKFAGYIRIDTDERLETLKKLLSVLEVYINHFLPSMKCTEKVRRNISHNSRRYDTPQTPYQRFMAYPAMPKEAKQKMSVFHETLNPKVLHDEILRLRKELFRGAKFTKSEV